MKINCILSYFDWGWRLREPGLWNRTEGRATGLLCLCVPTRLRKSLPVAVIPCWHCAFLSAPFLNLTRRHRFILLTWYAGKFQVQSREQTKEFPALSSLFPFCGVYIKKKIYQMVGSNTSVARCDLKKKLLFSPFQNNPA